MAARQKRIIPLLCGLIVVLLMLLWQHSEQPLAQDVRQRIESVIFDLRMNASLALNKLSPDERVVIVTVDEKSLNAQGHWPWPRDRIANIVNKLFESGAAVVGFDIMFIEAQRNSAEQVMGALDPSQGDIQAALKQLIPQFDYDQALAQSFGNGDVVLGYTFHQEPVASPYALPESTIAQPDIKPEGIFTMPSYSTNIPLLQQNAMAGGFVTARPDADGILRRTPLIIEHQGKLYASLSLEMARLFYLLDHVKIHTTQIDNQPVLEQIELGKTRIPVDAKGRAIIPYRGKSPAFTYISASDILDDNVDLTHVENKLIIIGATALGLSDLKASPIQNIYPGVEVHANMLSAILDGRFYNNPPWAAGANFALTLACGLLLAILMPWMGPLTLIVFVALISTAAVYMNFWWWQQGWVLDLAVLLCMIGLLAIFNISYGFFTEYRRRNFLKTTFGQYVPPALVDRMLDNEATISMAGESRELSVLFADIRSFTTISESLTPSELKQLLNEFFTHMTHVIFDHHGTIDKYVGDMIMAFWGAPLDDGKHAQHAVEAAMAMLATVEKLKPEFAQRGFPEVNIGIGINTGVMNVGDMGSNYRRAYTVLGDSVNLASRIEGLTKYYGAGLVIGENTYQQLDGVLCRKLDRVRVKGKLTAVEVYEPLCRIEQASETLREDVAQLHRGLACYWSQQWSEATTIFAALRDKQPDSVLYNLYLERIDSVSKLTLPADWDGVYERRSK